MVEISDTPLRLHVCMPAELGLALWDLGAYGVSE